MAIRGLTNFQQASGGLGSHILKALLQANFEVTVLARSQPSTPYDTGVKVIEVEFTSEESLTAALAGQDAVVSAVGPTVIDGQKVLIDAAVASGVKRFIPSDFGSCTTNAELKTLPIYSHMASIQQYLDDKAKLSTLSYTILASGAFLEYIFKTPTLLDFKNHTATLIDDGNNRLSTTRMAQLGTAVAGILSHPNETNNRTVHVSQVIVTQNKLLEIARKLKPETEWKVNTTQSSVLLQDSLKGFAAGDSSFPNVMKMLSGTSLAGDRYGAAYDETDNKLLGVDAITEEELEKLVAESLG